jgi:hypothetical protein
MIRGPAGRVFLITAWAILASTGALASERLTGIACRSVHLGYDAPESDVVYNEITVQESHPGTYFCVLGFQMGYFGIQELSGGRKVVIFSVWDPGAQDDHAAVSEDRRAKVLFRAEDVIVRRFGGEGTGAQSFFPYAWQTGMTYRFAVRAKTEAERTEFSAHFLVPEEKAWKHLVTFETLTGGGLIRDAHSFVEDFLRNRTSTGWARRALFGPGWARTPDGRLHEIARAQFTADDNRAMNIDAGVEQGRFYLATGGATSNIGVRLWSTVERPKADAREAPVLPP